MAAKFRYQSIALTYWLEEQQVRDEWSRYFPRTTPCVRELNRSCPSVMVVPPSPWLRETRRYSSLCTAFDYAAGLRYSRRALLAPWDRVREVVANGEVDEAAARVLAQYLIRELGAQQRNRPLRAPLLRALGLVADLDAVFRAPVVPPEWFHSDRIRSQNDLNGALRLHYPRDFVQELRSLIRAMNEDLRDFPTAQYNPVFGTQIGKTEMSGDGDLLSRGTLLDLKVSVTRTRRDQLWQLLGYYGLDRAAGGRRFTKVGLYNPRYRSLWVLPVRELVRRMGARSAADFCRWFARTVARSWPAGERVSTGL